MLKIIICGTGKKYNENLNTIRLFEMTGEIKVCGVITPEISNGFIDGYKIIRASELSDMEFDYCLFAQGEANIAEATKYMPRNKIIPIDVLKVPYFNFARYDKLKKNPVSIISANCWGGICYHYLGLEFTSPTINLWIERNEFNRFANNLEDYLKKELIQTGTGVDHFAGERLFPIASVGDINLFMNHYDSFEEGKEAWEKRIKRINWGNLLFLSFTDDEDCAKDFCKIKRERKYIFVPKEMNIDSECVIKVPWKNKNDGRTIAMYANSFASGNLCGIDVLSLLCGDSEFERYK